MGLWTTILWVGALCICQTWSSRLKRQEPDYKSEETVEDYAGNENAPEYGGGNGNNDDVAPANDNNNEEIADYVGGMDKEEARDEPKDTFADTFNNPYKDINNGINEDRFGGDRFEGEAPNSPEIKEEGNKSEDSEESKRKKHPKKNKYLKKTLKKVSEFLKKVLDPNKLMENAYVTEMLRRFSDHETKEVESKETEEHHEHHHEIPIPKKTKKRRGRPSKKDKTPPGITGLLKKGIMSLTQMEVDKKKLKRRVRLIKRIARKAKKPLKTAVKIFLSSRNQGMGGGYGGGGYANNY